MYLSSGLTERILTSHTVIISYFYLKKMVRALVQQLLRSSQIQWI